MNDLIDKWSMQWLMIDVLRHTDTQSYEYTHIILELLLHLKKIEKKNNISKFYCGLLNDYKTRFMTKLSWMFAISLSHCLVIIFGWGQFFYIPIYLSNMCMGFILHNFSPDWACFCFVLLSCSQFLRFQRNKE